MHSPRAFGAIGVGLAPLLRPSPWDLQALMSVSPQTLTGASAAAGQASPVLKAAGSSATAATAAAAATAATESLAAPPHPHASAQVAAAPGALRLHGRRGFDSGVTAAPAAAAAGGSAPLMSQQPLPAMLLQIPTQISPQAQHSISPRAQKQQHNQYSHDLEAAALMGMERAGFQATFDGNAQTEALMARLVAVKHEEEATRKALLQAQLARIKREEAVLREEMTRAMAHAQAHTRHQQDSQALHQVKQQQAASMRDKQDRITSLENLLGFIFGPFHKGSARAHPQ